MHETPDTDPHSEAIEGFALATGGPPPGVRVQGAGEHVPAEAPNITEHAAADEGLPELESSDDEGPTPADRQCDDKTTKWEPLLYFR